MKVHDFKNSLQVGAEGEQVVINWLSSGKNVLAVIDFRNMPKMQKVDIDFGMVVETITGVNVTTWELKTDTTTLPNLFYEEVSAQETGSKGCLAKTKADFIIYRYENLGITYVLQTRKFRKWVAQQRDTIISMTGLKTVKNRRYDGSLFSTTGLAIPRDLINRDLASFGAKVKL